MVMHLFDEQYTRTQCYSVRRMWHRGSPVASWAVSIIFDVGFCLDALERALWVAKPEVFNSDQGSRYTSTDFTGRLEASGVQISMDGRGRAFDNIIVERLWRSVKYAADPSALGYQTPATVYCRG